MSHSYTRQLLHIVFSTKERRPFLHGEVRPRMRGYIDRQEAHHQKHSFEDVIRKLVKNHGVEFDERFFLA